jgi:hypothetical protein
MMRRVRDPNSAKYASLSKADACKSGVTQNEVRLESLTFDHLSGEGTCSKGCGVFED